MPEGKPTSEDLPEEPKKDQKPPSSVETSPQSSAEMSEESFDINEQLHEFPGLNLDLEEDRIWVEQQQKKEKETLKAEYEELLINIKITQRNISMHGIGQVPLQLERQMMAYQKRKKELEDLLGLTKLRSGVAEAQKFEDLSQKIQEKDKKDGKTASINWFDDLNDREKFFVITLSMFNGIRYSDFRNIYETILEVMQVNKGEEEKPSFGFALSDDELVKKVKAHIEPADDEPEEIIEFVDDRYADDVFDIVRRRHRHILLSMLPILKQVVERHRHWDVRVRAALAVAEIGKTNFRQVCNHVLAPWASDARAYVRASVGYSLAHIAKDEASRAAVRYLLTDWAIPYWRGSSETWRYPWTVASTYKQIGSIEAEWAKTWAYQGLESIADFNDTRLVKAVIYSLVILSLQGQLEEILTVLKKWIEEGDKDSKKEESPQTRCKVGILAFLELSEIHSEHPSENTEVTNNAGIQVGNVFELVRRDEEEKGEMWQLAVVAGVRAFESGLYNAFFDLIARWTQYAGDDPLLQETVRNLLVEVYGQVKALRQAHIANRLGKWERQKRNKYLAKMATTTKTTLVSLKSAHIILSPKSNNILETKTLY